MCNGLKRLEWKQDSNDYKFIFFFVNQILKVIFIDIGQCVE